MGDVEKSDAQDEGFCGMDTDSRSYWYILQGPIAQWWNIRPSVIHVPNDNDCKGSRRGNAEVMG